jgi:hypothetical protein
LAHGFSIGNKIGNDIQNGLLRRIESERLPTPRNLQQELLMAADEIGEYL